MGTLQAAPAFEGLLFTVFQQLRQGAPGGGLVLAFTSANPGEGVTHSIRGLVAGLGREAGQRTLIVDARVLRQLSCEPGEVVSLCRALPGRAETLFELEAGAAGGGGAWHGAWEHRRDCLQALRGAFDSVLLDCPSLKEGNDLLAVAPFVDGVLLVVEADKTRRDQVLHAEKAIEFARGKLIGHILNKRSYVVPEWVYKRL